ncbi:polyribonucleotide nucleotidyltransferase [Chitinivibrio alkaliphilus]|uniref:Polyribonucleotide nucleotidyltransferase n=1 Tax=Chitinivibrio alkaliphilus ACht1 TaxID=1313304 RepID=U7D8S9_9BACT|nr:polyribonucleotide nucleotidyltransferase [Chitinivibrio alkaliphilus]ERP31986.1 polyribonucleotide nucleotidyltransferase [Chitinivibrio alkaliphilus ACht1]
MTVHSKSVTVDGTEITLETGRIAKQANGSATIRIGDTILLSTACNGTAREGIDFFPLTVEFIEQSYAAGKIPGSFFKREGRPSTHEILSARVVDRPIRPLFPKGYKEEVQIVNTVISADEVHPADVNAVTAASFALCISDLPFNEPVAAVRVTRLDGKLKAMPTREEAEKGDFNIIIAGTADSIMMVEGGSYEVTEDEIVDSIMYAHDHIKSICQMQKEFLAQLNVSEVHFEAPEGRSSDIDAAVKEIVGTRLHEYSFLSDKEERYEKLADLQKEVLEGLEEKFPEQESDIKAAFHDLEAEDMRTTILKEGKRIGGRGLDDIRKITCELDFLPRAHGSAIFTRGETQALVTTTLGNKRDEMIVDNLQEDFRKTYYLHYNFPPYCVGETGRLGIPKRREIGHGHLAENALSPVLPPEQVFPYTVRIVSDITESNGSSSMASICGGSLSLMAAGVPIKCPIAGIAMGLISDGDDLAILTDILGTEDHLGDMDFKVAGSREGITAIQMDIKIDGITPELMKTALGKARTARMKILDIMEESIAEPRTQLSNFAPAIVTTKVNEKDIGIIIGPGGKTIKEMQEEHSADINIADDGTITIAAQNRSDAEAVNALIEKLTEKPEVNKVYEATVKKIVDFGAFCEYLPKQEGLLHISEIDHTRVEDVNAYLKEGDTINVKIIGLERNGKVRLSLKALKPKSEA